MVSDVKMSVDYVDYFRLRYVADDVMVDGWCGVGVAGNSPGS